MKTADLKKSKLFVSSAVIAFIFCILMFVRTNNHQTYIKHYADVNMALKIFNENIKNIKDLPDDMDQLDMILGKPDEVLPDNTQNTRILRYFLTLAQMSQVQVNAPKQGVFSSFKQKTSDSIESGALFGTIEYQMQIEGGYSNILEYIQRLYSDKFFAKVGKITMKVASKDTISADLIVKILGKDSTQNP